MDLDAVTFGIMQMLDILNKEEQSIDIEDSLMVQIKEYLTLLDLILEIDLESLPFLSELSVTLPIILITLIARQEYGTWPSLAFIQ